MSLTRLSLSSSVANLTEPEPEDRPRPAPVRRFYRSRSSGNLVDKEAGDIKSCLIQEDEEDDNIQDTFETDFQRQRWVMANRMNGFERYT